MRRQRNPNIGPTIITSRLTNMKDLQPHDPASPVIEFPLDHIDYASEKAQVEANGADRN